MAEDTRGSALFAAANKALRGNDYARAAGLYEELRGANPHPAVGYNLALTRAVTGDPGAAMQLLDELRTAHPAYLPPYVLAAEILRRTALGDAVEGRMRGLRSASELLKTPTAANQGDPQTCIVAADVFAQLPGLRGDCVRWHKQALAAVRFRRSRLTAVLTEAYIDDLTDKNVHYYSMPPEDPVVTGSLTKEARDSGRVVAVVAEAGRAAPPGPPGWTAMQVTYGAAPCRTEPGHVHVRTVFSWAARFCAAALVADTDVPTAAVWEPALTPWDERVAGTEALITTGGPTAADRLGLFCMKPASVLEVGLLRELFRATNVPPADLSSQMATEVFDYLCQDTELDVEALRAT